VAQRYPFTLIENDVTLHSIEGPTTRTFEPARTSSTTVLADGTARRDVFYPLYLREIYPDDLLPEERLLQRYEYKYQVLKAVTLALFERLRWNPSATLGLIEWGFPIYPVFGGDGTRRHLRQYHPQAKDVVEDLGGSIPRTEEVDRTTPSLKVDGVVVPLTGVDQVTWDGGDPPPGEAWWLLGGQIWRLADVPAIGARIQTQYLPAMSVVEDVDADRGSQTRSGAPGVEPRSLVLMERSG
jgi:hypothetical protein